MKKGNLSTLRLARGQELTFTNITQQITQGTLHPDAIESSGWSLLMLAAEKNDFALVKYLIIAGASIYHESPNDCTLTSVAAENGNLDILLYLLSGVDVSAMVSLELLGNLPYLLLQHINFVKVNLGGTKSDRFLTNLWDLLKMMIIANQAQMLAFVSGKTYQELLCVDGGLKAPSLLLAEITDSQKIKENLFYSDAPISVSSNEFAAEDTSLPRERKPVEEPAAAEDSPKLKV
jgi:ankyrin repeat protein